MQTYSLKAECPADFDLFSQKLAGKLEIVKKHVDEEFYDTLVEFKTPKSLSEMNSVLSKIEDSEVMMETIATGAIVDNQLIADHLG